MWKLQAERGYVLDGGIVSIGDFKIRKYTGDSYSLEREKS